MEGALKPPSERPAPDALKPVKPAAVTPPSQPGARTGFLSDAIVELGYIDLETAEWAVEQGRVLGQTVGAVLVENRVLSEDQLSRAIAEFHGLDHVDLDAFDVDLNVARLISRQAAQRYRAVPIGFDSDGALIVALADPVDPLAVSDIGVMTKSQVRPMVAVESAIKEIIERLPDTAGLASIREPSPADEVMDHQSVSLPSYYEDPIVEVSEMALTDAPVPEVAHAAVTPAAEAEDPLVEVSETAVTDAPVRDAPQAPVTPAEADVGELPNELETMRSALERLSARLEAYPPAGTEEKLAELGEQLERTKEERAELGEQLERTKEERAELGEQLEQAELRAEAASASLAELRGERDSNERAKTQLLSDLERAREATRGVEQRLAAVVATTTEIRTACEKLIAVHRESA